MSISVGVIGTGVMGAKHARLLQTETRGADLAAVCDADTKRAAAFGVEVFSDPLALIRSDAVEAVVVASPDETHEALVMEALSQGKPVLCEKPLAATTAQAAAIIEAEIKGGRRLVQVGFMRRFDPAYAELRHASTSGRIGQPMLLHNVHRNAQAPEWFTGAMAITNAFVHEIDASRWLLGSEMARAHVFAGAGGDPLMIQMQTDRGEMVSTEVFLNATYGYHVHAELVGRDGAVSMATPTHAWLDRAGQHGHGWPDNWLPRFNEAYRRQLNAWVQSIATGIPTGASSWDGYVASALADQIVAGMQSERPINFEIGTKDSFYEDAQTEETP
ncbi:Gfo/Idh/MocA family protein [Oceanicola sp. 502str15]|uniref:Gfo/Idh/MocA family protein n=1 Tax=Oceanicola sp. 502str15 TaxID=2696061 RepID=UPI0020954DF1|nr:Gfo/Idh/MocA family oxidoreductase [Oceanicola sp. 502str15]MCO6384117.1 Gfo/Idh/MocA family oxidoreductase [Oceanicola sp. 502str15]